ncbi:MAG: 5'-nucleotidase, lipoprotein e(P4) family, partial [Bacteroidetes bacterium]|nr:5'-nucleotidase, lipoprotein e(P4) family [Bacteroidota bacterium]
MRYITLISFILIITACGRQKSAPDAEQLVMSSLWFQNSAEARALYYQAYNIARLRIELALDTLDDNNKYAVVADIDETILDNSPSEARNILEGERYSNERWMAWTSEAKAQLMPGSLDFANFLKDRGVELYYISNRSVDEKDVTLANLKKFGFPFADDKHVLLKEEESSKTPRRTL